MSEREVIDLANLGFGEGGWLLLRRALRTHEQVRVEGTSPSLHTDLAAWCRSKGHRFADGVVHRGDAELQRWADADRAGAVERPSDKAPASWGLAARGALVEAGGPELEHFTLSTRDEVWADEVGKLYAQAAASQWDPAKAIPWDAAFELPEDVEDAVVQVMTYLIENETAALAVPAAFAARVHPHYREVMQLLALQAADEARHIEVFTRRASLKRSELGLSTVGGRASLQTLLEEPDFELASLLLSVLGEGSFLNLLAFIKEHAPDPVTREVMRLTVADEARHVAFGVAHLARHAAKDSSVLARYAAAIERRHASLVHTAGLNEEVFDALMVLAAGGWEPQAIARGFARVQELQRDMDVGRRQRLQRIGFSAADAERLSSLHTRNFM